jgi:putative peptidoglycan lipid II flippase
MSHLARSSFIVAFFFGVDKILGFLRQVLTAHQFGLSYQIDVFNAANNIPDLLSALISGGALGVALIPVLSEYIQKQNRTAAWEVFSRTLNLAFMVTGAIAALIAVFARPLVRWIIAPGFPSAQQILTSELMRLDLLAILIFSVSGLVMAGLQANQHFLLPAMAPALYNLGQIFGLLVLAPSKGLHVGPVSLPGFGLGVHGLVYGVILGALLHLFIQIPGLVRYRFHWLPAIGMHTPALRQVLRLLGPRVLTMFFLQLFFIARDNIASRLGEGSVTALNYGWFIMQVPETLIGTAIGIAMLPAISELFARGEKERFAQTVNQIIRVLLALTIPVAGLLAVVLRPLVQTVFGFDAAGTELVVWVTRFYLLGLIGHSLLETAARSFYAQQDATTPLFLAAYNAVAYIVFAIAFSRWIGTPGIALANTLSFTSEALLLLFFLNRRFPGILRVEKTLLRVTLVAIGGMLLAFGLTQLPFPALPLALGALATGGMVVLPFLLPEIRLLIHL